MHHSITLVSAQPQSAPSPVPAPPTIIVDDSTNLPVVEGKWHHVCLAYAIFWLTDAAGEVNDTYCARFGANFWIFARGTAGNEYEGYAFACDASGQVGLLAANAIAPGWRPNALQRFADREPQTVPAEKYASAS